MFLSFLPSFLPSASLVALKITTLIVVATALAHQLHHAIVNYPGKYLDLGRTAESATVYPANVKSTPSSFFGACLMVKDDNALLSEWLAYHYTVLPLRYIVVGVDVNSTDDPSRILHQWADQTDLRYEILPASEFSDRYREANNDHNDDEKTRHHHELVNRQKGFITECADRLQKRGIRWTAYIDSDEYVVPNRISQHDADLVVDGKGHESIKAESLRIRKSLQPVGSKSSTVLDVLRELQHQGVVDSCYTMPRLLVGSLENRTCSDAKDLAGSLERKGFRSDSLQTLRFSQHAPKGDFQYSKFGKVFVDLGRIPQETLARKPRNIHRPYRDHCGPAMKHFPDAFFYLNHYIGSWERYSARRDARRNRVEWEERAFVDDGSAACVSGIHEWFQRFVSRVGEERAKDLLSMQ